MLLSFLCSANPIGNSKHGQRGINLEQKDAVQQLFESNSWPWNAEVTDVCETEGTGLSTSLDKFPPFVFKSSSL